MKRVSLARQVRMLGLVRGVRVWRQFSEVTTPASLPEVRIHHGVKPSLPDYRSHKAR